jgi:hypothetical protein
MYTIYIGILMTRKDDINNSNEADAAQTVRRTIVASARFIQRLLQLLTDPIMSVVGRDRGQAGQGQQEIMSSTKHAMDNRPSTKLEQSTLELQGTKKEKDKESTSYRRLG